MDLYVPETRSSVSLPCYKENLANSVGSLPWSPGSTMYAVRYFWVWRCLEPRILDDLRRSVESASTLGYDASACTRYARGSTGAGDVGRNSSGRSNCGSRVRGAEGACRRNAGSKSPITIVIVAHRHRRRSYSGARCSIGDNGKKEKKGVRDDRHHIEASICQM